MIEFVPEPFHQAFFPVPFMWVDKSYRKLLITFLSIQGRNYISYGFVAYTNTSLNFFMLSALDFLQNSPLEPPLESF